MYCAYKMLLFVLSLGIQCLITYFISVVVFRLHTQHKHLCQRLHNEEELQNRIDAELKQHE